MVVQRLVSEVMTQPVISVTPLTPLQEAVKLLSEHHISGLPVVDGGKLKGSFPFSDEGGAVEAAALLGITDGVAEPPPTVFAVKSTLRGSFCQLSTCEAAGAGGVKWLIVNGHSDADQVRPSMRTAATPVESGGHSHRMAGRWVSTEGDTAGPKA